MARKLRLAVIKEGKEPEDRRTPLTPKQMKEVQSSYDGVEVFCQASPQRRCIRNEENIDEGIQVVDDVSHCDIFFGVKEVPINRLEEGKTYLFFSHTIKKQSYNKTLLQEILKRKIRLIDYECLKDENGNRIIAFGRYAGIVGAYNGIMTYGKKFNLFHLKRAKDCFNYEELRQEYKKIKLSPVKIVLTGSGRAAKGAAEVLNDMGILKVSKEDFLNKTFGQPVFVQLGSADYHHRKDGQEFLSADFYENPEGYLCDFLPYASVSDILIAAAYWNPKAPVLFSEENMKSNNFNIKVVADITCDIKGSIPSTIKPTTIEDPVYDYDILDGSVKPPFSNDKHISVMAIDNLPSELARDASEDFGRQMLDNVLPYLLNGDTKNIIYHATIAKNGKLTDTYQYLEDYVSSD